MNQVKEIMTGFYIGIGVYASLVEVTGIFFSENITAKNLRAVAGHDGIHITSCDNVTIENCLMTGPAKYLFRGSMTKEEKAASAPSLNNPDNILRDDRGHRFNMLSAFTYYADFSRDIRRQPGRILIRNCEIVNADRLLHYNFSGNETWQNNRPLEDVTFENITASGIRLPLNAYGDRDVPLTLELRGCDVSFAEIPPAFMHLCHHRRVTLENVTVHGTGDAPLIRRWSKDGVIEIRSCDAPNEAVVDADEQFFAQSI